MIVLMLLDTSVNAAPVRTGRDARSSIGAGQVD
jgi:hypothetical protein